MIWSLMVTNTWFLKRNKHFVTYRSRGGRTQIDNMLGDSIVNIVIQGSGSRPPPFTLDNSAGTPTPAYIGYCCWWGAVTPHYHTRACLVRLFDTFRIKLPRPQGGGVPHSLRTTDLGPYYLLMLELHIWKVHRLSSSSGKKLFSGGPFNIWNRLEEGPINAMCEKVTLQLSKWEKWY